MPIAFSSSARVRICLEADKARPENERVYFLCRFMTAAETNRAFELAGQAADKKTGGEETKRLMREALSIGLVGPVDATDPRTGKPVPCTIDGIDAVLSHNEKWDLLWEYPRAVSLGEHDLKKSDSPSQSTTGESARENPPELAETALL
jgi:hypothetical protein